MRQDIRGGWGPLDRFLRLSSRTVGLGFGQTVGVGGTEACVLCVLLVGGRGRNVMAVRVRRDVMTDGLRFCEQSINCCALGYEALGRWTQLPNELDGLEEREADWDDGVVDGSGWGRL
jgi:hypothetical protein